MTAALEGGEWSAARPGRERPGTHLKGGWVGAGAGLDGRKISCPSGSDPGPSSLQSVAIPTELPGPLLLILSRYTQVKETDQAPLLPPDSLDDFGRLVPDTA